MIGLNEIPNSTKKLHKNTVFEIFKKPKGIYVLLIKNDDLWYILKKNRNQILSNTDKFLYPSLRNFEAIIKNNIKELPNGKFKFCIDLESNSFVGFSNLGIDGIEENKAVYKGLLNFGSKDLGLKSESFDLNNLFVKSVNCKFCFKYLITESEFEDFNYRPLILFFNDIVDSLPDKIERLRESKDDNLIFNVAKIFVENYNDLYGNYDISDFVYKSFVEKHSDWNIYLPYDLKILIQKNFNILYQFKFVLCLFEKSNIKSDIFLSEYHRNKYINFMATETNM